MNFIRLGNQTLWIASSRFAALGLSAVFTVLLANRLGVDGFGRFAFIAAILFVGNALTTFGTDMHLIREIAAKDTLSGLRDAFTVQVVLSTVFIACVWLMGGWIPNQDTESILALKIYSLALFPLAMFTVCTIALRGKQHMTAYALLNLAAAMLQILALLFAPSGDLIRLLFLLLIGQVALACIAWAAGHITIPGFNQAFLAFPLQPLSLMKACVPIAGLAVLGMLYQRMSVAMLSVMDGPGAAGIFSVAARAVDASKLVHVAAFTALYPALAQGNLYWKEKAEPDLRLAIGSLVVGALFIALAITAVAPVLVSFLFGRDFDSSIPALQILAWTIVPFTINSYLILSLLSSNRELAAGLALTVSLVAMLILNLWLIPLRGPLGCAWAGLIAECVQSAILIGQHRSLSRKQSEAYGLSKPS